MELSIYRKKWLSIRKDSCPQDALLRLSRQVALSFVDRYYQNGAFEAEYMTLLCEMATSFSDAELANNRRRRLFLKSSLKSCATTLKICRWKSTAGLCLRSSLTAEMFTREQLLTKRWPISGFFHSTTFTSGQFSFTLITTATTRQSRQKNHLSIACDYRRRCCHSKRNDTAFYKNFPSRRNCRHRQQQAGRHFRRK